jgi:hypothetical protein
VSRIRIHQSGGFTPFYVVEEAASGKILYTSPWLLGSLLTKLWCWRHGFGWPTAAQMNG